MPDLKLLPALLILTATLPALGQTAPAGTSAPNPPSSAGKATAPANTPGTVNPDAPKPGTTPASATQASQPGKSATDDVNNKTSAENPNDKSGKPTGTTEKSAPVADRTDKPVRPAPNATESATPATPAPPPAPPAVNVTVQAPAAESPRSDLVSGWIGLGILAAAGFFGWKALARRGVTVNSLLSRLGIEETTPAPPARPNASTPSGPTAPPLPSLADLPAPAAASPHTPSAIPTPGRLTGIAGAGSGTTTRLSPGLTLGRDKGCGLVVADDSVSRQHASFTWSPAAGWVVTDLGSSNGTFLNGRKVVDPVALRTGDQVQFGESKFRFEDTP